MKQKNSMKKKKKIIISGLLITVIFGISLFVFLTILNDSSKLSSEERKWINDNINNVQNVYICKDVNVFCNNGSGVYYDFLNDFSEYYNLKVNPIAIDQANETSGIKLDVTKNYSENDTVLFTDHYVVLSNEKVIINDVKDLNNSKIGVLINDLEYVKKYLNNLSIEFAYYETKDELYKNIANLNYLIVPRIEDLNYILSKDLKVDFHLGDLNKYYVYENDDTIFSNIVTKYLQKWLKEEFLLSYNQNTLKSYSTNLGLNDTDLDKLVSIDYNYGFVINSPYEAILSGNYGGIVASYLQDFSSLTNAKFNITKYKNYDKLEENIAKGKVDIYFDYNANLDNDFILVNNGITTSLSIITTKNNNLSFNSINGLIGKEVYVLNNSKLHTYLKSIEGITIKTYNSITELSSLNKKDYIIVIDTYQFDFYKNNKLDNYTEKYRTIIKDSYNFKTRKEHLVLNLLLNSYILLNDESEMINNGLNLHDEVITHGNLLNNIAKYTILIILILLIVVYLLYKNSKKIRISRKVKKDDKMRFIDQLTSLKNRAYLSGFIKDWNNNTIYPQTVLVVDLNRIQEINDKYGYDEGDKQIQACANALIKTQLDNSEIMRSDGNEFVIYLVGYNKKQVTNYIHKLSKEFKKLPYPYGAEFGYSFIENDLKTIEDAMNEAVESMKKLKESGKNGK